MNEAFPSFLLFANMICHSQSGHLEVTLTQSNSPPMLGLNSGSQSIHESKQPERVLDGDELPKFEVAGFKQR